MSAFTYRPDRIAGTAYAVTYATVLALRNQYASRASAPKLGYRSASMFPSASSRLFKGSSSNTTSTIGGVRSIVSSAAADSDGRKLCFTPGSRRTVTGRRARRAQGPSGTVEGSGFEGRRTRGKSDGRRDQRVPREHEEFVPPKPRHHESCRRGARPACRGTWWLRAG